MANRPFQCVDLLRSLHRVEKSLHCAGHVALESGRSRPAISMTSVSQSPFQREHIGRPSRGVAPSALAAAAKYTCRGPRPVVAASTSLLTFVRETKATPIHWPLSFSCTIISLHCGESASVHDRAQMPNTSDWQCAVVPSRQLANRFERLWNAHMVRSGPPRHASIVWPGDAPAPLHGRRSHSDILAVRKRLITLTPHVQSCLLPQAIKCHLGD